MTTKAKTKSKPAAKKPAAKKTAANGAQANGTKPKKNWTMAELLKLSANEVSLLAWQESYNNRQKQKEKA